MCTYIRVWEELRNILCAYLAWRIISKHSESAVHTDACFAKSERIYRSVRAKSTHPQSTPLQPLQDPRFLITLSHSFALHLLSQRLRNARILPLFLEEKNHLENGTFVLGSTVNISSFNNQLFLGIFIQKVETLVTWIHRYHDLVACTHSFLFIFFFLYFYRRWSRKTTNFVITNHSRGFTHGTKWIFEIPPCISQNKVFILYQKYIPKFKSFQVN